MSFNLLAPVYRGLEFLLAGGLLQRSRTAHLDAVRDVRQALLLGEGPGRFLEALLRAHPHITVTCVEQSRGMIRAARRHLGEAELARVRFEQADALHWEPPAARYDLVVTNFFLDCFSPQELDRVVAKAAGAAAPGARWLLADFREPESGWRRWRGRAVLAAMYAFFRPATGLSARRLTPPDAFLARAGFRLKARRLASFGLIHADLWERNRA